MNEIRYINMCIVKFGHMQIEAQIFQSVIGKMTLIHTWFQKTNWKN